MNSTEREQLKNRIEELEADYLRLHEMFVKRGIELSEMEARLVGVVVADTASENSVEPAVNAMFEAADKASQAGAVVDWRSTCVTTVRSLVEEINRLQQEVLSEQEAMRVVLEAEKGDNNE